MKKIVTLKNLIRAVMRMNEGAKTREHIIEIIPLVIIVVDVVTEFEKSHAVNR